METSVAHLQSGFVLGRMRFNLAFVVTFAKRIAYLSGVT